MTQTYNKKSDVIIDYFIAKLRYERLFSDKHPCGIEPIIITDLLLDKETITHQIYDEYFYTVFKNDDDNDTPIGIIEGEGGCCITYINLVDMSVKSINHPLYMLNEYEALVNKCLYDTRSVIN